MEPIKVTPSYVIDGATFYVLEPGQFRDETYVVKIRGFDSPPKGSEGYDVAREKLASFLKENQTLFLDSDMDKVGEEPNVYFVCRVRYPRKNLDNLLEDLADYMKKEMQEVEGALSALEEEIPF